MWRKHNKTGQTKLHRLYIVTYVIVVLISLVAPLITSTPKAYAAGATTDQNEQHKRTQMVAFKKCIETNAAYKINSNIGAKVDALNIYDRGDGRGGSAYVGYEIDQERGSADCNSFGSSVRDLGYANNRAFFADLYDSCTPEQQLINCAAINYDKRANMLGKMDKYIQDRALQDAERIRRLKYTFELKCATPDAGNELESPGNNPNFVKIDDSWFRKKGVDYAGTYPMGTDFGEHDETMTCNELAEKLGSMDAYISSGEAYKRAIAEEQCIAEGRVNDLVKCIEEKLAAGVEVPPGPGEGGDAAGKTGIDCDAVSWNPLKWFMCPLLKLAESAVRQLDNLITYMLTFPTADYFDNSNNSLGNAWGSMRNLSLGLLVIAGLVMVISQAVSWGPFDAYTIKKVMPRLVFAVIFISISLPILRILIEFSNVAGVGIRELIERLFDANFKDGVTFNNGAMTIGTVAVGAAGLSLGFLGILSLMGTAILAVLIAFLVLTARQLLILMLVIVAPIAIACYILPNTERVWKMWWDFFWRALVAFPIISAFIATGHAFAKVASYSTTVPGSDSTLHDTLASLIAFAAYFGPYFALPFAFRLAGGAVGQIGGLVNDRSRGAFDRLKGFRKQEVAKNWQNTKSGRRFNPEGRLSGLNRHLQTATLLGKAGINPARMRGRINSQRDMQSFFEAQKLLEENGDMKAVAADDHLLTAMKYDHSRDAIERRLVATGRFGAQGSASLNQAVSMVERAQKSGSQQAVSIASDLGRAATGTGYDTHADMYQAIMDSAGGNQALENAMLGSMRSSSERARRPDLATAGHVDQYNALNDMRNGTSRAEVNRRMRARTIQAGGVHSLVAGRNNGFDQLTQQLGDDFNAAMAAGDHDAAIEYASQITSIRGAAGSASPENRQEIMALMAHVGIDPAAVDAYGRPFSTADQLGEIVSTHMTVHDPTRVTPSADSLAQEIHTRAGAYDAGGATSPIPPGYTGVPGPTP